MRKYFKNPKAFKHDGRVTDSERGGGSTKKDSEVSNLVKESSKTYL
jgi:hypothetical protein